jgi:predicted TIM-barrel fold metal-dependent hydrolase
MNIFDAHFHIIDPRFPLVPNGGFLPEPFTCDDYLERTRSLHIVGGAVVSGSFQAFDQRYLEDALKRLGPGFGRLDFEPGEAIGDLATANPEALLFGTDLPSTRARRPFMDRDIDLIRDVLEPAAAEMALHGNAVSLYTFQ